MAATASIHGMWSTRLAFILAASGSAVGLGNVWRFPYTAGEYGGGAFVLVYLLCVAGIGIPIMMAEILLGRRGRQSPINTMRTLAEREGKPAAWSLLGWMGIIAGFLILSFYSVIAGWTLAYVVRAAGGAFTGIDAAASKAMFDGFVGNPEALFAWHTVFMVLTVDGGGPRRRQWPGTVGEVDDARPVRPVAGHGCLRRLGRGPGGRRPLPLRPEFCAAPGQGRRGDPQRHGSGLLQPELGDGGHHGLRVLPAT